MVEAFWTMYFDSEALPYRGGTVAFAAGSIVGHDLEHEFHGTYRVIDDTVRARVSVLHYAQNPYAAGLPRQFEIILKGKAAAQRMVLRGRTVGRHPRFFRIVCLKRLNIHQTPASAMVRTNVHDGYVEISAMKGNLTLKTMMQFLDIIAVIRYPRRKCFLVGVLATARCLSPDDYSRLWTYAANLDLSRSRIAYVLHEPALTPDAIWLEAVMRSRHAEFKTVYDYKQGLDWLGPAGPGPFPEARETQLTSFTAAPRTA